VDEISIRVREVEEREVPTCELGQRKETKALSWEREESGIDLRLRLEVHKGMEWNDHKIMEMNGMEWNV